MKVKLHWGVIALVVIAVYLIGVNFPVDKVKFTKA